MSEDQTPRHLRYIRDSIILIEGRTQRGRTAFLDNIDVQDAVLWRLQTLADATGKLPTEMKNRHPSIPWRAIYGFRNVAAHAYQDLLLDRVWEIVEIHLPALKAAVVQELDKPPTP